MHDDFAVRVGLEDGRLLEALAEGAVVVDLSVDGEDVGAVFVGERLSSSVCQGAQRVSRAFLERVVAFALQSASPVPRALSPTPFLLLS